MEPSDLETRVTNVEKQGRRSRAHTDQQQIVLEEISALMQKLFPERKTDAN